MKTPTHFKDAVTGLIFLLGTLAATAANANPIAEFPLPISSPNSIVFGPDGNLWFTEQVGRIGRVHRDGTSLTEFFTPAAGSGLRQVVVGPDNNLWFVEVTSQKIGRIEMDGTTTEFSTRCSPSGYITSGPNNSVWFPENCTGETHLSEMATLGAAAGTIKEHTLGTAVSRILDTIATGADGNIWFGDYFRGTVLRLEVSTKTLKEFLVPGVPFATLGPVIRGPDDKIWVSFNETIARITVDGGIDEFSLPDDGDAINSMTAAPDGSVWATEYDGVLRRIVMTPSGISSSRYPVRHDSGLTSIAPGPRGKLWFTEYNAEIIGNIYSDAIFFDSLDDEP